MLLPESASVRRHGAHQVLLVVRERGRAQTLLVPLRCHRLGVPPDRLQLLQLAIVDAARRIVQHRLPVAARVAMLRGIHAEAHPGAADLAAHLAELPRRGTLQAVASLLVDERAAILGRVGRRRTVHELAARKGAPVGTHRSERRVARRAHYSQRSLLEGAVKRLVAADHGGRRRVLRAKVMGTVLRDRASNVTVAAIVLVPVQGLRVALARHSSLLISVVSPETYLLLLQNQLTWLQCLRHYVCRRLKDRRGNTAVEAVAAVGLVVHKHGLGRLPVRKDIDLRLVPVLLHIRVSLSR